MTKINPYHIVKQAGVSPGGATLVAMGLGGGIGALIDAYKESKGETVENQWRRPLLGAVYASLPFLTYGLTRGSYDRDENGNRTMSMLSRYFSDDDSFWSREAPNARWQDYMDSQRKYYITDNDAIQNTLKKAEWATDVQPIDVNNFNQVTWLDASRGRTPLESAGFVTDTLNSTQRRVGSNLVSPGQVINTMVNAGIGYGTAWLAGKALGAMANVSPATQRKLCEIGTWGGMLGGISNAAQRY